MAYSKTLTKSGLRTLQSLLATLSIQPHHKLSLLVEVTPMETIHQNGKCHEFGSVNKYKFLESIFDSVGIILENTLNPLEFKC